MALVDVNLSADVTPASAAVMKLIREAESRIERFIERRRATPVPAFVPSDFVQVHGVLRAIAAGHAAPGNALCEWGSGMGVVAALGAILRYDACGIEIDPELVEAARQLASDFGLSVEYACGSFVPHGGERFADRCGETAWLAAGGVCGHEELGLDPNDFDVIFAYPWPGEERVIEDLFEHYAAVGALLVTYRGLEGVRVQRKAGGKRAGR